MYRLYVFDLSYFSGKMEGYLRYKGVPFTRLEPSWGELRRVIYPNTGWMKLPVIQTPDGRWLQDSTPMIRWFEAEHPEVPVVPADPVHAFLSDLLEDYADEWLWRPALYYRWAFAKDRALYRRRFVEDFLYDFPLPNPLTGLIATIRQDWTYLRGDGITRHTRAHVESIYLDTLSRLQAILSSSPFLLGGRATVADFGFFASMFRHFSLDPTPSRLMRERAPAVYEWVARLWNADGAKLADAPLSAAPGEVPPGWGPLLEDVGRSYLPYLTANAAAWRDGGQRFDFEVGGVTYRRLPAVQYRAWCREQLQARFRSLDADTQAKLQAILEAHGAWAPLWAEGVIPSGYDVQAEVPAERRPVQLTALARLRGFLFGTGWNRGSGVRPE
ncbi:MAG: glutathione S-transferase C-terminal domain-containing protein [Deltaproteobacteria bacterium]|nr:glutathione S-transferase C-terminal domain-containing protein [Deltaproteobacteria bacterium]